ncbi:hypothetical protein UA75_09025 [Actinoalloteichus sp. GBA129-24]|uniref:Uncharacterized protein n=1 Tax=Actinoalloteichus fjordicus TaxID=1612552 RepID=A0AAC9LBK8_9PSEU|nr:hypothetical protein UA74_09055 [Actinoalloteichus fjordicus]APU19821.1 hypothetical protein UA75_09025 [Actinoalloteichus sp. GBA129-24]
MPCRVLHDSRHQPASSVLNRPYAPGTSPRQTAPWLSAFVADQPTVITLTS